MNVFTCRKLATVKPSPEETPAQIAARLWLAIIQDRPGLTREDDSARLTAYNTAAAFLYQFHRVYITPETLTDPSADDHRPHPLQPKPRKAPRFAI
jgi:hypothetical protein